MLWGGGFLFLFLAAVGGALFHYLFAVRKPGSSVSIDAPDQPLYPGDALYINYRLNLSPFMIPGFCRSLVLRFECSGGEERNVKVSAAAVGRRQSGELQCRFGFRGVYSCTCAEIEYADLLGFASVCARFKVTLKAAVRPQPVRITEAPAAGFGGGGRSARYRKERGGELLEVREYVPGDDPRRINWKAAAHTGKLLVRQGEKLPLPRNSMDILLDLSPPADAGQMQASGPFLDNMISYAGGLLQYYENRGVDSAVYIVPGGRIDLGGEAAAALQWTVPVQDRPEDVQLPACTGGFFVLVSCLLTDRAERLYSSLSGNGKRGCILAPLPAVSETKPGTGFRRLVSVLRRLFLRADTRRKESSAARRLGGLASGRLLQLRKEGADAEAVQV